MPTNEAATLVAVALATAEQSVMASAAAVAELLAEQGFTTHPNSPRLCVNEVTGMTVVTAPHEIQVSFRAPATARGIGTLSFPTGTHYTLITQVTAALVAAYDDPEAVRR
ncbi:hypothetical protein [Actinokineospora enzanensis]|uniref:hypothetical protein n=1 Tax=Actinokineospora enzanensis TaxID=155975 RepID=UPI0003758FFB|nr:hypothetical protein [Actinokineospora enzanensis]